MNPVIARLVLRALPQALPQAGIRPRPTHRFEAAALPARDIPAPPLGPGTDVRHSDLGETSTSHAATDTRPRGRRTRGPRDRDDAPEPAVLPAQAPLRDAPTEPRSANPAHPHPVPSPFRAGVEGEEPPRHPGAPPEDSGIPGAVDRDALLLPTLPAAPGPWHGPPPVLTADRDGTQQPDVRISIGRIDLRTVRPEPRPVRSAPARPKLMSLEDYLAKGRRGR